MQSTQSSEQQCTMCNSMTLQHCKNCICSAYCSKACQKADWPVHKLLCAEFKNFSKPPEGGTFKRGILFPDDTKTPRFVWVPTTWAVHEVYGIGFESPDFAKFGAGAHSWWITGNNLRSRQLQNGLVVHSRDRITIDDVDLNQSILAVTRGFHPWGGPLLAMKLSGLGIDRRRYKDIDLVDFRDVVDFFCSYPRHMLSDMSLVKKPSANARPKEQITGVRINCRSDQDIGGRPKFEPIYLPIDHPVFEAPVPSISKRIELPIRISRCPPCDTSLKNMSLEKYDATNPAVTFLHMNADTKISEWGWGWAPMEWQGPAGTVVVVREDRKPILPQHIEALCHYCQYVLQPLFEDSMGCGMHPESPMKRRDVMQMMTRRMFENFYIGYENWKRDNDPEFKVCTFPY